MADPVRDVVSVLKNALDQIQGNTNVNDTLRDAQRFSTSAEPSPVGSAVSTVQSQSIQEAHESDFVNAARRDFSRSFPSLGGGGKRMPMTNPNCENKRPKVAVFQPRKSWTHDFCLLFDQNCGVTPSINQSSKLKDAGLGRKRIVFPDKKASFVKVMSILETEFPKLKSQDGAFELLRAEGGGNARQLCLIPIPSNGYNISYLKEMFGPSTLIYIRPMKTSISMEKLLDANAVHASPTTECSKCKERVVIADLRQHNLGCKPNSLDIVEIEKDYDFLISEVAPLAADGECPQLIDDDEGPPPLVDYGEGPSRHNWLSELKALFPDSDVKDLEEAALQSTSLDEAAEFMLEKHGTIEDESASIEDIIQSFVKKNSLGYSAEDEHLAIDRESLWMDVMKFYKKCIGKPDILKRELSVSFKNEDGLDGGAMKVEFFTLALLEVKNRLFEGKEPNLIPIKDATKGLLFQLAGMIISHSVSQEASIGLPVLAPYLYAYIVGFPEEEVAVLVKKEFIPLDASTSMLHDLLTGLDGCQCNDDIQALLEENQMSEAFWQVINSSRWPKEQVVNMTTKDFLLQHLVVNELLTSRKNEMDDLKEGLKALGFFNLISRNKQVCRALFCASHSKLLNPDIFKGMMHEIESSNFAQEQSLKWFLDYLGQSEDNEFPGDSRCRSLLQFWTGWSVVPFGGLAKRLKVTFLPDDDKNVLPTASACTATLRLPTVHSSKVKFFQFMDIAIKYGKVGFPNP